MAELITNKQCASDQLTALTYYIYLFLNNALTQNFSGNIYDGMKNYQPVFRERESFSSLSGNIFGETKHPPSMSKIKEEISIRKHFYYRPAKQFSQQRSRTSDIDARKAEKIPFSR